MVVDAIVSALLGALNALLSLLPSFTIPTLQGTAVLEMMSYGRVFNRLVPLQYMMDLVAITLAFHITLVAFDGAVWIWHQVHGSD